MVQFRKDLQESYSNTSALDLDPTNIGTLSKYIALKSQEQAAHMCDDNLSPELANLLHDLFSNEFRMFYEIIKISWKKYKELLYTVL